jgi:cytochrome P450
MSVLAIDQAPHEAQAVPLDRIDVSDPRRFQDDTIWPYFERLRREDPVHYCRNGMFGSYWSITKYRDIMAVDTNHKVFSSEAGGITIVDRTVGERFPNFIAMDPPKHDELHKALPPAVLAMRPLCSPMILSRIARHSVSPLSVPTSSVPMRRL